jgi:hypothetical protein
VPGVDFDWGAACVDMLRHALTCFFMHLQGDLIVMDSYGTMRFELSS